MTFRMWIFLALVVVAAAGGGFAYWQDHFNSRLPEGIAYGNGRIEAVQVDISTKIAGRVQDILVQEGDLVKPGQKVATIDTDQLKAQHLRAEADIASAESQVAAAEASIAQAKAQLILTEQELDRASRLSARDVAKATLAATKAELVSRQRSVDAARATAQEIKTQIDDSVLVSPIIGRVLYRLAEPGEVLGAGGKVLTLVNLSDIYMEIFLPAADAHRVSIGADARIKLDVLNVAIPAKVSFVSPESQFTPKQVETPSEREKLMFRVKVRVPQDLVLKHIDQVKTGVRGVAYVMLDENPKPEWPEFLQKLPPDVAQPASSR